MNVMERWTTRYDRQSRLMGGMMERTGVDVEKAAHEGLGMRMGTAVRQCLFCRSAEACAAWQAGAAGRTEDVPEFCPNAAFFRAHRETPAA